MSVTTKELEQAASLYGLKVMLLEPGEDQRVDVVLQDEVSEQRITIPVYPWSSLNGFRIALGMETAMTRGNGIGFQKHWLA